MTIVAGMLAASARGLSRPSERRQVVNSNGSADRFREVVLPHLADALALARWLTGSRHDAEDVVQEACIRALAGIDRYDGRNARAWVLTIVRNTCFTWLAKHRPKSLVVVGDLAEIDELAQANAGAAEPTPTPEAEMIRKADAAAIENAIGALPAPLREMLVLRDISGLSYKEIAAMLTMPIGTVMSRLARARAQLAIAIGEAR
jgi:RNA polymerase sigma-70 factor (ECF subfamily)